MGTPAHHSQFIGQLRHSAARLHQSATVWDWILQTLSGVSGSAQANSTVHTSICKFSPPACLQQCNSANLKHLHQGTQSITVWFSRGRLRALVLESRSIKPDRAPNTARASGAGWAAQLCALSHQKDGQTHTKAQLALS